MSKSRLWLPLAVGSGAVYLLGAAHTVQWADASKLTLYALAGHVPSLNPGDHPGWTLLAWLWLHLFPKEPAYAGHLLSALVAATAVGLLAYLLTIRGHPRMAVVGTALIWAIAHAPWWAAEMAESYSLAIALTLGTLVADERGQPCLAGILAGWAAATHALTLFLTGPALFRKASLRSKVFGFALGSAPVWLALFVPLHPDPLTGFFSGNFATVSWHWQAFFSLSHLGKGLVVVAALIGYNLGPMGLWNWRASAAPSGCGLVPLACLTLFLASYATFRLHLMVGFLLLGLLLWCPVRLTPVGALAHVTVQLTLYLGTPHLLSAVGFGHLGVRLLPGRNNATYFLNPIKATEKSALLYSQKLFAEAPPGAVVLADFNPGAVLKLRQKVERVRKDVIIIPTAVDDTLKDPHPPKALAELAEAWLTQGRKVVLADTYEPYYHLTKLQAQGLLLKPCGPGVLVEKPAEGFGSSRGKEIGAPTGTRTPNLLIRSQMLYPIELSARPRLGKYNG